VFNNSEEIKTGLWSSGPDPKVDSPVFSKNPRDMRVFLYLERYRFYSNGERLEKCLFQLTLRSDFLLVNGHIPFRRKVWRERLGLVLDTSIKMCRNIIIISRAKLN